MQKQMSLGIVVLGGMIIVTEAVILSGSFLNLPNDVRILAHSLSIGGGTTTHFLLSTLPLLKAFLGSPVIRYIMGKYLTPLLAVVLLLSGSGVLARKNLARVTVVVFSAINILFVAAGLLLALMSAGTKSIFVLLFIQMALSFKLFVAACVYLIFFTRPAVKAQFRPTEQSGG